MPSSPHNRAKAAHPLHSNDSAAVCTSSTRTIGSPDPTAVVLAKLRELSGTNLTLGRTPSLERLARSYLTRNPPPSAAHRLFVLHNGRRHGNASSNAGTNGLLDLQNVPLLDQRPTLWLKVVSALARPPVAGRSAERMLTHQVIGRQALDLPRLSSARPAYVATAARSLNSAQPRRPLHVCKCYFRRWAMTSTGPSRPLGNSGESAR